MYPPSFLAEESDVVIEETATNPWSADFDVETFFSGNAGPVDISMDDESSEGSWYLPSTEATMALPVRIANPSSCRLLLKAQLLGL